MKIRHIFLPLAALLLLSSASCSVKKPKAEEERETWLHSLNDSIAKYRAEVEETSAALHVSQTEVGDMISKFEHVANPRHVEGYYIYQGWKNRYPLQQTGVVARITDDERFELIAVLSGGNFNQIAVSGGSGSAATKVVPHDQALNYRAGSLNTVCFYGAVADSVGMYIADNMSHNLTVAYMNNGSKTSSFKLPSDEKEMIAATYKLYAAQKTTHQLERKLPMLAKKIDTCRKMLESLDSVAKTQN
ncbi:MAG: hypothetical protein HDR88_06720 [Bacteroides sp.]|nr:hypothetical protein [Bacteroides sp.]